PMMPRRFVRPTVTSTGSPSTAPGSPPAGARVVVWAAASSSSIADPRIEHGVEEVDGDVHEDVADGDERDQRLDGDVLPLADRLEDQGAEPRQREDDLDDQRAAHQRADVEAGHGEQGEARRAQG